MLLTELIKKKLIKKEIPSFIEHNTHYLCMMGSVAYGCSEDYSDMDIYGWCIPPKGYVFPHLSGYIKGFGKQPPNFECWQEHHIFDKDKKREYDISIFGIVRYFQLVTENNPNMLDSLFVPRNCVLHSTQASELLRENRRLFLHKGACGKYKGYSFSQFKKCKTREKEPELEHLLHLEKYYGLPHSNNLEENVKVMEFKSIPFKSVEEYRFVYNNVLSNKKRAIVTKLHGYDTKFMYHTVRLLSEVEEILTDHDLTLDRYDRREMMKAIRRGEWSLDDVNNWVKTKEIELEKLYQSSTLRHKPDEEKIKQLLLNILESHFGNLENAISNIKENEFLDKIKQICDIVEPLRKYF